MDSGLRIAMQIDPIDEQGILVNLMKMNDEGSQVRIKRFANEMARLNPSAGARLVERLAENGIDFTLSD